MVFESIARENPKLKLGENEKKSVKDVMTMTAAPNPGLKLANAFGIFWTNKGHNFQIATNPEKG